jgi:hypothetical protein
MIAAVGTGFAAYFTGQQWGTAVDTEHRQLRAYVGTIPAGIENFGDITKQRFKLTIKNFRTTPAYDVGNLISDHNIFSKTGTIQVVEKPEGCGQPSFRELVTLFPGGQHVFIFTGIQHAVSGERLNHVSDIDSMDAFIYYGTICYHDTFGMPHYTNYCWQFSGKNMAAENAEGCREHNDSD